MLDPVAHTLANAPTDDEPVSEEERLRFHDCQAKFRENGGRGISMEDVLAEFGLRLEDFPLSSEDTV